MNVVRDRLCFRFNGMPGSDSVSLESELRPVTNAKQQHQMVNVQNKLKIYQGFHGIHSFNEVFNQRRFRCFSSIAKSRNFVLIETLRFILNLCFV